VAGPNFGTGSSREHAVWALTDYGFRAVISPRFGDIFRNNSTKAGLVPVQVSAEVGRSLLDAVTADPSLEITVDLERLRVEAPAAGVQADFPLDAFTQHRRLRSPPAGLVAVADRVGALPGQFCPNSTEPPPGCWSILR
jgi:3-isopropylmalate/(R)-2-methylmalate dehydratase small subunit